MEVIQVTEFYGNDYCNEKLAYYYGPGKIVYIEEKPESQSDKTCQSDSK